MAMSTREQAALSRNFKNTSIQERQLAMELHVPTILFTEHVTINNHSEESKASLNSPTKCQPVIIY